MIIARWIAATVLTVGGALAMPAAHADEPFPSRPVKIIVQTAAVCTENFIRID